MRPDDRSPPNLASLFTDPKHIRADAIMVKRALREKWPIAPETLAAISARVSGLMNDPQLSRREHGRLIELVGELDKRGLLDKSAAPST